MLPLVLGLAPLSHPLSLGLPEASLRASSCGECHAPQYADWAGSRHHAAHDNSVYLAGLAAEPQPFCTWCHSPLAEQAAEVLPNLAWYGEQGPHARGRPVTRHDESLAADGIGCVVCHLREGTVLTPNETTAIHPTRAEPALTDGRLCGVCHEFPVPEVHEGVLTLSDVAMQSTWTEWRAWGGAEGCVDCHMPGGRHLFRGAHDVDYLRGSVEVTWADGRYTVRSVGVGHALPSGDLFRHLTLEVDDGGGWRVLQRIGRRFVLRDDAAGHPHKVLTENTSLRPGVALEVPGARAPWRLVYHYGSEVDEARGFVPAADALTVVASGD